MLERLLNPHGVAIIGASQDPTKLGYGAARNLVVSGYQGAINLVNPGGGELFGLPMYPSPAEVPDPVDLAVILVPAPVVPGVLKECGQRGFGAAIIGAGGFREKGEEGAQLEAECLRIAEQFGMRVLGPNCIGFLDTHLPIDTSFLPLPGPIPGDITFLSHSGAICEAVIDWARGQGFGLARLVSLGNQMDLTETDLLAASVEDEDAQVIAMYLEGVSDGRAFVEQAMKAVEQKPVVAIKVGRSERGSEAVASHTGALAGEDEAYSAAFRRAGVMRAKTSEEMFDWARALAWAPLPAGRRVAILTNAGGPGAIAVDALEDCRLQVADLADQTKRSLQELLPAEASLDNPVDMLASAGPSEYARCLALLLKDDGVDSVMIILPPPPMASAADVAGALLPVIRAADKPVVLALMGEELIAHAAQLFRGAKVPEYRFPERAASALKALSDRAEQVQRSDFHTVAFPEVEVGEARSMLSSAPVGPDGFIGAAEVAELIRLYGLPLPEQATAESMDSAAAAAGRIGYPVAIKVAAREVVHKSDIGGVALDIGSEHELRQEYT
ncbi:MAG: acetate--CoA ligase family protein, partial [Anaerolineales bacterium]